MEKETLEMLKQIAAGIAGQFGSNCEVAIHDLSMEPEHSIVHIENGHISGRSVGDGGSYVLFDQWKHQEAQPEDHVGYLMQSANGKILKSTTMYIRDAKGRVTALLSINYDITTLSVLEGAVRELISPKVATTDAPKKIVNVNDLLDDLIQQSVSLIGKPVALMSKDDKIRAIQFLNDNGALLITKSGDKISKFFNISKYTLYSYIDAKSNR